MERHRVSGILLHPTSLPGRHGIGGLGGEARRFVDFLAETEQGLWQILPLGPTGYGNSPYMSFSAYGGNPLLISLDSLVEEGLLDASDLHGVPSFPQDRVDYPRVIDFKLPLLRKSFARFQSQSAPDGFPRDYYAFCEENAFWLEDYALFMALKGAHGGRVWTAWEAGAARHDPDALFAWRHKLAEEIQFHHYAQYVFFKQWDALRRYCHALGVNLVGDIPIYVAHDSADVWAHRDLFHLDGRGDPLVVGGVPPDYFSTTGQRWGNPIYRWETMAEDGYRWWIDRFRTNYRLLDTVRLDHFRGFQAYWEIPAGDATAAGGRWVKGPGEGLFLSLQRALGDLDVIAEDLGVITPEVDALRDRFDFPGMRILQMAFSDDPKASDYKPHNYPHHCVVYTASHDHNTTVGWFTSEPGTQSTQTIEQVEEERRSVLRYLDSDGTRIHWDLIRLAMGSVARTAVFPLQDVLGLGSNSRMNRPGTGERNWEWRFRFDMLAPEQRDRLRSLTRIYQRDVGRRVHAQVHQVGAEAEPPPASAPSGI